MHIPLRREQTIPFASNRARSRRPPSQSAGGLHALRETGRILCGTTKPRSGQIGGFTGSHGVAGAVRGHCRLARLCQRGRTLDGYEVVTTLYHHMTRADAIIERRHRITGKIAGGINGC